MGTVGFNAGGSPAMDWHPIQGGGGEKYSQSLHAIETGIRAGWGGGHCLILNKCRV